MRKLFLIIGIIWIIMGFFIISNFLLAAGIIFIILSFFGQKQKKEEKKGIPQKKTNQKCKCVNCGAEVLMDDRYCPDCGKKTLP